MDKINEFLLTIGKKTKENRTSFWASNNFNIRLSKYQGNQEAGLWFRTNGCSYDHLGGCFMCDYSGGMPTVAQDMINYVNEGLDQLPDRCHQLLVSPSGSMLDEEEIPSEALAGILESLDNRSHERYSFETRIDTVTKEKLDFCQRYIGQRFYRLFLGLESANDWILKYCINKQLNVSEYTEVHKLLKDRGIISATNILISVPFLSVKENIELATQTVKWLVDQGVQECFLFPVHVKSATPLCTLYQHNMFEPPSLWTLIEIIRRLGPKYYKYIRLSWYRSYGAFNVISSPTTCEECIDRVYQYLDEFAEYQNPEAIEKLLDIECECKHKWQKNFEEEIIKLPERVLKGYEILAREFLGDEWWEQYASNIKYCLYDDIDSLYEGVGGNCFNSDNILLD